MSLDIRDLSKKYGENSILENINITLKQGELISLVGPSGSGKSTLLKCISGMCNIDSGEIQINSKAIQNLESNQRNIGYMFQESPLFPHLTAIENILFNMSVYDESKLSFLLNKMQIKHLNERYPHEISGGENQRIAVARSLIRKPDLFLLDEPFTNLDAITKKETKELVFDIIKETNITTILVNHDIQDSLEISDKILVLDTERRHQIDTPAIMYSKPASLEIANLFGEVNCLTIEDKKVYFRPEDVKIVEKSQIKVNVIKSVFIGKCFKIIAEFELEEITIYHESEIQKDTLIYLKINQNKILHFN